MTSNCSECDVARDADVPAAVHRAHVATPGVPVRRAAIRDVAAVSPGIVPFGITLGISAVTMGTGAFGTLLGAVAVYGGSAQLTTMTVLHLGAGLLAAVLAGAVVNARIMLYGAALEPRFRNQPTWFRMLGPLFILDQTYLSATGRPVLGGEAFRRYWAWLGSVLLLVWVASVTTGLVIGPLLPPLPHLGLVGAALFVAMLVPKLVDRASLVAAAVGAGAGLAVAHLVPPLGILGGAAAGVLAATLTDRRSAR